MRGMPNRIIIDGPLRMDCSDNSHLFRTCAIWWRRAGGGLFLSPGLVALHIHPRCADQGQERHISHHFQPFVLCQYVHMVCDYLAHIRDYKSTTWKLALYRPDPQQGDEMAGLCTLVRYGVARDISYGRPDKRTPVYRYEAARCTGKDGEKHSCNSLVCFGHLFPGPAHDMAQLFLSARMGVFFFSFGSPK